MKYTLRRAGQTFGPYDAEEVQRYMESGNIVRNDEIAPEGSGNWMTVDQWLQSPPSPTANATTTAPFAGDAADPAASGPGANTGGSYAQTASSQPAPAMGAPNVASQGKSGGTLVIILSIVGGIVLLGAIGVAAYFFWPRPEIEVAVSVPQEIAPVEGLTFYGSNMIDGDPRTAWQTERPVGKRVTLYLRHPADINQIKFKNGHHWLDHPKYGNLWSMNARIRRASLYVNGIYRKSINFSSEYRTWETFPLEAEDVESVEIQIDSIYSGWKYDDLGLSEILLE